MHHLVNIENKDEKERGSVEIKLRRHLAIEFRLINGIRYNFGITGLFCDSGNKFKDCHIDPIQRKQR